VIHVGVRHYDVADYVPLWVGKSDADAARIHRHAFVNEKASQPLRRISAAAGIE